MNRSAENWRERWADRLGTAAQAVSLVRSGNRVWTGGWTSVPMTLCSALAARHRELSDVEVYTFLTPFIWDRPDVLESFRVVTGFVGPYDRAAVRAGRIDYVPLSLPLEGQMPAGLNFNFDIAMIPIFVDVVVTEQGVARLRGKTLRQRIGEMIAIAYPDFRSELRTEAKRLYGVG